MTDQHHGAPGHDKFHADNTNEVVDFVDRLKSAWLRWGDWLLAAMLVASASWFAYTYYTRNKDNAREEAFHDLAGSDSPDVLAAISAKTPYGTVGPQAALCAADLFLKKAALEENADKAKDALTKAGVLYKQVADNAALPAMFRANAQLGLASVAENQKDWGAAETAYQAVIAQAGDALPGLADLAKARIALLPTFKQPVVFGAEPVAAPAPAPAESKAPPQVPLPAIPEAPAAPPAAAAQAPAAPKGLDAPLK